MSLQGNLQDVSLKVHICELSAGDTSWSATIAVEGPVVAKGLMIGLFFEGRRLQIGELDEWGYLIAELDHLPPPSNMMSPSHFEVRSKMPPRSFISEAFHPPVVSGALKDHLERSRQWPRELPLRCAQLQGVSLSQSELRGVDFTGANLTGAKFWGADLTGAIFRDAILNQADFNAAKMSQVDLQGASVHDAEWTNVNLKGADLRSVIGLSVSVMQRWGDLVTLDETQQARVKLMKLAKKEEEENEQRASMTYRSQSSSSTQNTSSSSTERVNSLSLKSMSNADSINRYGEQTFYRSPNEQERKRAEVIEEAPSWSAKLPPVEVLSDEEVEERYQTERLFYRKKLEKYQQKRTLRGGVSFTLNMIPNGAFEMGCDEGEVKWRPRHKVKMSYPLLVGETPVTQELFERVMRDANFKFSGAKNPAESLSWSEAIDFCNRLSQLEGLKPAYELIQGEISWDKESNGYRLPTEAEWEYFARAGVPSLYAGSNDIDQVAWYKENSADTTQAVAQKRENAWGLYDISGNVWEWCYDTYLEDCYQDRGIEPSLDPIVIGEGPKVIRGGSWSYEPEGLRLFYRSRLAGKFKTSRVGFRIVRSPKLKSKHG